MKLVGDGIIEANVVVINRISPDCAKTKRDGPAILPPDEITDAFRHTPGRFEKILFGKNLKCDVAALRHIEVKWINFIDHFGTIVPHFQFNPRNYSGGFL